MSYFSLTDLFLVGLALDISGAVLLAKGLLLSPEAISVVSGTYWDSNKGEAQDRCKNRVYGEFGIAYLGFGFALQALGYALDISGVHAGTGAGRLIAGLGMSAVAVGLAVVIYIRRHGDREERLLAAVEAETERRQNRE